MASRHGFFIIKHNQIDDFIDDFIFSDIGDDLHPSPFIIFLNEEQIKLAYCTYVRYYMGS